MLVKKKFLIALLLMFILVSVFSGCEGRSSSKEMKDYLQDVAAIKIPKGTKIVGLGEASHGNHEFMNLKKEVFEVLVKNYGYRAFAIEGDFGGGQVVNDYILNGKGSPREAIDAIGFWIYDNDEIVQLLTWMHDYNKTVKDKEKLRFYGFDMQKYDNNKLSLLSYIKKVDREKYTEYESSLSDLNDKNDLSKDQDKVKKGLNTIEKIIKEIDESKDKYISKSSKEEFDLAQQYALCIKENTTLQDEDGKAYELRDSYMAKKVEWILSCEKNRGNEKLFIAGHNGHIQKSATSSMIYTPMGYKLKEIYGEDYFSIGTEFYENSFLAKDEASMDIMEFKVKNENNDLIKLYAKEDKDIALLDIKSASKSENLEKFLSSGQSMGNIGAVFSKTYENNPGTYIVTMVPKEAYNAIIFVKKATPSKLNPK